METLTQPIVRFKTNIKCEACLATVTPFLNEAVGEGHWQVDMQNSPKILTTNTGSVEVVEQAVAKAGYKAEPIN